MEVKGPGDSLSWVQRAWIDILLQEGVHVQVARVVEKKCGGSGGGDEDVGMMMTMMDGGNGDDGVI